MRARQFVIDKFEKVVYTYYMACKIVLNAQYLKTNKIALALSGGRDSMALAHILKSMGAPFFAVNFDHESAGQSPKRTANLSVIGV